VPTQPELDDEAKIERRHWGEMESDDEEVMSDEDDNDADDVAGGDHTIDASGFATPAAEGFGFNLY
jgi:hypothetical protein